MWKKIARCKILFGRAVSKCTVKICAARVCAANADHPSLSPLVTALFSGKYNVYRKGHYVFLNIAFWCLRLEHRIDILLLLSGLEVRKDRVVQLDQSPPFHKSSELLVAGCMLKQYWCFASSHRWRIELPER